jgi:hypothetical protein
VDFTVRPLTTLLDSIPIVDRGKIKVQGGINKIDAVFFFNCAVNLLQPVTFLTNYTSFSREKSAKFTSRL